MPDYKEMYFKLFRATEEAIRILTEAQLACEEMYISSPEERITVYPPVGEKGERKKYFKNT